MFTILLLPILHLRLLPIHLLLRISCLFFTSHKTFKTTLSLRQFKHLDSSNVVNLEQITGNQTCSLHLFCTNLPVHNNIISPVIVQFGPKILEPKTMVSSDDKGSRQKFVALPNKIDKFSKDPFKSRDDVRRRLRALSCEKSSIIADPQKPAISPAYTGATRENASEYRILFFKSSWRNRIAVIPFHTCIFPTLATGKKILCFNGFSWNKLCTFF